MHSTVRHSRLNPIPWRVHRAVGAAFHALFHDSAPVSNDERRAVPRSRLPAWDGPITPTQTNLNAAVRLRRVGLTPDAVRRIEEHGRDPARGNTAPGESSTDQAQKLRQGRNPPMTDA